jgi:hypothetical protein
MNAKTSPTNFREYRTLTNPVTGKKHRMPVRSSKSGTKGQIKGLWKDEQCGLRFLFDLWSSNP